jgi:polyhydroxyalkanoate synthesis regulator phasin
MAEPASALRALVDAVGTRLKDDGGQIGARANDAVAAVMHELGFITRREYDELELRVAQLEHRLRLVEGGRDTAADSSPPDAVP